MSEHYRQLIVKALGESKRPMSVPALSRLLKIKEDYLYGAVAELMRMSNEITRLPYRVYERPEDVRPLTQYTLAATAPRAQLTVDDEIAASRFRVRRLDVPRHHLPARPRKQTPGSGVFAGPPYARGLLWGGVAVKWSRS